MEELRKMLKVYGVLDNDYRLNILFTIAENLMSDPGLINHPEWYLALSMMAQRNGFDFFDNPEMKKYGYSLKPNSTEVWEIIDKLRNCLFKRMGRVSFRVAMGF